MTQTVLKILTLSLSRFGCRHAIRLTDTNAVAMDSSAVETTTTSGGVCVRFAIPVALQLLRRRQANRFARHRQINNLASSKRQITMVDWPRICYLAQSNALGLRSSKNNVISLDQLKWLVSESNAPGHSSTKIMVFPTRRQCICVLIYEQIIQYDSEPEEYHKN